MSLSILTSSAHGQERINDVIIHNNMNHREGVDKKYLTPGCEASTDTEKT